MMRSPHTCPQDIGAIARPNLSRRRALATIALAFLQCFEALARAAAGSGANEVEYQIKAAYLYKFAAYVEWPPAAFADSSTPVVIGVIGADALTTELKNIKGNLTVNNREILIRPLKLGDSLSGLQILFIGRQESGRLKQLLDSVQSQPVLTVTEWGGAINAGSVINFVPVDDRIRFEVSTASAERSGLKISARLLGVAQRVETRRP